MRRTIRLRESELKRMISESVRRVVNEWDEESINPEVDELIQKTIEKLPGKAIHADAHVVPTISDAIKMAYKLGCSRCGE